MLSRVTIIVPSISLSVRLLPRNLLPTSFVYYYVCRKELGRSIVYGVFKDFVMWLLLKTLCSRVLSSNFVFLVMPPSSLLATALHTVCTSMKFVILFHIM